MTASWMPLISTLILLRTMLCNSDGAMLPRLLGLLVLASLCSAILQRDNSSSIGNGDEEDTMPDPNTNWYGSGDGTMPGTSPLARNHIGIIPEWSQGGPIDGDDHRMIIDPSMPIPDPSMCDLIFNAPQLPPIDQIPFDCICSHCKGTVGPKGDRGDQGRIGRPGSPGRRGMTGFKGRMGFTGAPGMKGQKGDLGEKGQMGTTGFPGMKGQRGFKGEKGDRGVSGPEGAQGPQGESGICPESCDSVEGPAGPQGTPGPAGARGLPGVKGSMGSKGVRGDKGDLGQPGSPGMNGPKGDQGEQGVCECTDGADGQDGSKGEKGQKGEKGEMGAMGTEGPMGMQGDKGDMGVMGPRGPCSPAIQSAFSAALEESFPSPSQPVAFPRVISNEQNHFMPNLGVYTAPVNGTYVFSFHVTVAERPLKVGLFLNFQPIFKQTETTHLSTCSQSAVLHLSRGDRVWLQVKDEETNGMFTAPESTSTFSGYLLNPDSCEFSIGREFIPPFSIDSHSFSWGDFSKP